MHISIGCEIARGHSWFQAEPGLYRWPTGFEKAACSVSKRCKVSLLDSAAAWRDLFWVLGFGFSKDRGFRATLNTQRMRTFAMIGGERLQESAGSKQPSVHLFSVRACFCPSEA